MTQLEWLEDSECLMSGEYQIRRIGDSARYRWCLETRRQGAREPSGNVTISFSSLRDAKNAAERAERDRLVRDTSIGHAVVGLVAMAALAATFSAIGNLTTFVIATLLFYLGLRSLTFAMSVKLGDVWGWTRDGGISQPPRLSDRLVRAGIAWLRRRSVVPIDAEPMPAVRVLPPSPPE